MIKAIIKNKDGITFVTEFPCDSYNLYSELRSVGIMMPPNKVKLTDNEDNPVSVKLYSDSDFGNHLLRLFSEQNTLADVNTTCFVIEKADESIKEEVEQNLLNDQYSNNIELICDIKDMTEQLGQVEMSFFCPLVGNIDDAEYNDPTPVDNRFLKSYEWAIREFLKLEQSSPEDKMAQFFDDDDNIKKKLISAEWTVDEYKGRLYGRIDCRFKEELTEDETETFKEWLIGQSADGFGEHIEQQPIDTEDGDLFVSFWHSGNSYFLCTEDELDDCIEESHG